MTVNSQSNNPPQQLLAQTKRMHESNSRARADKNSKIDQSLASATTEKTFAEQVQALPKDWIGDLTAYKRIKTIPVRVGGLVMGGGHPLRIQSMTTAQPDDVDGLVAEIEGLYAAGAELVRLTVPSVNAVHSLEKVKTRLQRLKLTVPLVADVHFTPNAALAAAEIVEKVRINPGNYVDKKRFATTLLSDEAYRDELNRLAEKFIPLLDVCKKHHTALRIGVNHGSLSDRIVNKYGDSPYGMVQSALEFLTIAEAQDFSALVLSMKSSNPVVMVHAYRLLVYEMKRRGRIYPLHLGVTEAGDGPLGRVKSATGMATLLCDGIGDTIRVSLTEDAVYEVAVCHKIRTVTDLLQSHPKRFASSNKVGPFHYYDFARRKSLSVDQVGAATIPKIFGSLPTPLNNPLTENNREALYRLGLLHQHIRGEWHYSDHAPDGLFIKNLSETQVLPAAFHKIIPYKEITSLTAVEMAVPSTPSSLKTTQKRTPQPPLTPTPNITPKRTQKTLEIIAHSPNQTPYSYANPYPSVVYESLQVYLKYQATNQSSLPQESDPATEVKRSQPRSHYIRIGLKDIDDLKVAFAKHAEYFHDIVWIVTAETRHFALECRTIILALQQITRDNPSPSESQFPATSQNNITRQDDKTRPNDNIRFENLQKADKLLGTYPAETSDPYPSKERGSHHVFSLGDFPVIVHWDRKLYLERYLPENKEVFVNCAQQSPLITAREELNVVVTSFALGPLLIDGLIDGVDVGECEKMDLERIYAIFQATRRRISRVDYISCPSCGRTLFDLQEVTAKIKQRTAHLKHIKIGIMGCIVNGPGEMADADYGYVGSGVGKISLYKGKKIVRRSIPEDKAVAALIALIREHGQWIDPPINPPSPS